jgi:hypothetical protein
MRFEELRLVDGGKVDEAAAARMTRNGYVVRGTRNGDRWA